MKELYNVFYFCPIINLMMDNNEFKIRELALKKIPQGRQGSEFVPAIKYLFEEPEVSLQ